MNNRIVGPLLLAALAFMALIPACSSLPADDVQEACEIDLDCRYFESCRFGVCGRSCEGPGDCPQGLYCHDEGVCTECFSQEHCSTGLVCLDGTCRENDQPGANPAFGLFCDTLSDCLGGEICLDGRCTPLCSSSEECPAARPLCHPEHYCVQCLSRADCRSNATCLYNRCVAEAETDGDITKVDGDVDLEDELQADGDVVECPEACNPREGLYCDAESLSCRQLQCQACDSDDDCRSPATCAPDPAADGNGICHLNTENCTSGYRSDAQGVCRPLADCLGLEYAGADEDCHFQNKDELPPCAGGMTCLFNSRLSFCSPPCLTDGECLDVFIDGCCGSFSDADPLCLRKSFCDLLPEE